MLSRRYDTYDIDDKLSISSRVSSRFGWQGILRMEIMTCGEEWIAMSPRRTSTM